MTAPDRSEERLIAELVRALNLGAEGREEYAERSTREDHRQFLLGEAAAFRSAARLIESGNVNHFLASALPSWRWSKEVDAYVMRENPRLNDGDVSP